EEQSRLLDEFFRVDEPGAEDRLYWALALKPLDKGPGVRGWASLTEALRAPVTDGTPPGILLTARTGAGKTLAGIRALRDCVVLVKHGRSDSEDPPPLLGWLPVRVRVQAPWSRVLENLNRTADQLTAQNRRGEALQLAGAVETDAIVLEL